MGQKDWHVFGTVNSLTWGHRDLQSQGTLLVGSLEIAMEFLPLKVTFHRKVLELTQ